MNNWLTIIFLALAAFLINGLPVLRFLQIKDYRWSRVKAHFYLPSSKHLFFNIKELIILILFVLSLFAIQEKFHNLLAFIIFVLALAYRSRFFFLINFTVKAIILSFISILTNFFLLSLSSNKLSAFFLLSTFPIQIVLGSFWAEVFLHLSKLLSFSLRREIKRKILAAKMTGAKVIVVVGSYGKSSVKHFLVEILKNLSTVLAPPSRVNQEFALMRFFKNQKEITAKFIVVEVGGYEVGEVKWVCKFLMPDAAIITGIAEQHLALFGGIEKIIEGEGYEAVETLSDGGIVVVNENHFYREQLLSALMKKQGLKIITYGLPSSNYSFKILETDLERGKSRIRLKLEGKEKELEVKIVVPMQIENLVGAIALLHNFFKVEEILEEAKKVTPLEKSFSIKKNKFLIIDSSYNINYFSALKALEFLQTVSSKKVVIFNGLLELGKDAGKFYRNLAQQATFVDLFIGTAVDYNNILREVLGEKFVFVRKLKEMEMLLQALPEGSTVLILGRLTGEFNKLNL